jgi:tRNA(Ile)-lysidine synthase
MAMELLQALDAFFSSLIAPATRSIRSRSEPLSPLVVAFSGGPDSTALLWGLARLGRFELVAAHLDHSLDPGSAARATAAARLGAELGARVVTARRPVVDWNARDHAHSRNARDPAHSQDARDPAQGGRPAKGVEAAARRVRYEFLEEVRRSCGATWVATAHHLDDQAETVLLRLLFGSGCEGLAGIRPVRGAVVRPLLSLPRAALAAALAAAGLQAVEDPGNRDLARPRNRIRHHLLPALAATLAMTPAELSAGLARLAERAAGAAGSLDQRLAGELRLRSDGESWGLELDCLRRLPRSLWPAGLAALHRRAGASYPPGSGAAGELAAQIDRRDAVDCDCGDGWRWVAYGARLELRRGREKAPHFTYTLEVPGEIEIPELALRLSLKRSPVEPWMFRGEPRRAGLELPLHEGACVTVRSRLPGDRLHPLGAPGGRRLKEILIDRHIPGRERERLPLLCVDGRIAWVPGVTIDERYRVVEEKAQERGADRGRRTVWVAELAAGNPRPGRTVVDEKGVGVPCAEANTEARPRRVST